MHSESRGPADPSLLNARALVPFLSEAELRRWAGDLNNVEISAVDVARFRQIARTLLDATAFQPAQPEPMPVSEPVRDKATLYVRSHPDFNAAYGLDKPEFLSVRIAALISAKHSVSWDGVEAAAQRSQSSSAFDFMSRPVEVRHPHHEPSGGVVFAAPHWDSLVVHRPRVRALVNGDYEVTTRVSARDNLVQVVVHDGRWILMNGHHRVVGAALAGRARIECLVLHPAALPVKELKQGEFFSLETLTSPRPPLVRDFLSDVLALKYFVRARQQFLRIATQVSTYGAPSTAST
jgi:hypothetical protein